VYASSIQHLYSLRRTELLINSYFNIVKREMIDMVPKSITYTLVNFSKDGLQQELLQQLYKPDVLDDLMKESDHVVARRKEVMSMISALNKAEEYTFVFLMRVQPWADAEIGSFPLSEVLERGAGRSFCHYIWILIMTYPSVS
jgi:hypothetical protein